MPKPKSDDPAESKRFLETAKLYGGIAGHDFDKALKKVASAASAPAKKPKARAKKGKR